MSTRTMIHLDGTWQFHHDATATYEVDTITHWREAQVPMPWQAQFADLRHRSGVGWYRRNFTLTEQPNEETTAAILHFGAVDYHSIVWVNGQRVGEHEGGYLPFEFDVTTLLRAGENELVVRVTDPTDDHKQWTTFVFSEIPHGKQSWYGPISGIWQRVTLELRPAVHFRHLRLTPNAESNSIQVEFALSRPIAGGWRIARYVYAPNGETVIYEDVGQETLPISLQDTPQRWSPESPALYTVALLLFRGDNLVDAIRATCGFRTVAARDGRIYLNGEPIYLRGALDQAYYPETIYTPPSLELLEDQVRKAKALGLNCLRCHIKIEDPRYYEVADRLGILVWTEIPNWIHLSAGASQRAKETFVRMVERDWNHPSIIAWTLIN
ncbi:MAG: beta galactosidase jelly roll domain-containing protein, partial [Caldilineaceae bacterium]|nr:beta galactosidase jelly roll domain-containing protein [Caldilineaceae bacterium]